MYHCHHSKGPGGEIPVADGISLGSLWNRSGHSGHPGANISRSLSVERTDCAVYSIFKVQKVLFTIHAKYEIFFVGCHSFFKSSLQACGSATGFWESPPNLRLDIQTLCLQNLLGWKREFSAGFCKLYYTLSRVDSCRNLCRGKWYHTGGTSFSLSPPRWYHTGDTTHA